MHENRPSEPFAPSEACDPGGRRFEDDLIIKAERIPKPGETILGGEFTQAAGGKGANQAVAAARAGGAVTFVARIGRDANGAAALAGFAADGINVKYVFCDPTRPWRGAHSLLTSWVRIASLSLPVRTTR